MPGYWPTRHVARMYASASKAVRISELNVPMLPEGIRKSLFGAAAGVDAAQVVRAKEHLQRHQLDLPSDVPPATEKLFAALKLPPLLGSNIKEHFDAIGQQLAVSLVPKDMA